MRATHLALMPLLLMAGMAHGQEFLSCQLAPGWTQSEAVHPYTADNLYDYKDGGAEGYLIYGFAGMKSLNCKSGENTLTIDVSEMNDADAAYGLFATNRDPRMPIAKIGMGGQVQTQSASFAKGKYYVEIVVNAADPNSDHTAELTVLVDKMAQRMEGRETPPEELAWFPAEDLSSTGVVPESVLGLKELKRGYVAKYKQGQAFIVLEDSAESAAAVLKVLRQKFDGATEAKVGDEAFQAKAPYLDGICIFRKGRTLGGYANLTTAQEAATQAMKLAARIP
ncbi:MAG: DUF6599 family protein [Acidobacteriaceae bacterium]